MPSSAWKIKVTVGVDGSFDATLKFAVRPSLAVVFIFTYTVPTLVYTLSLHDALPISLVNSLALAPLMVTPPAVMTRLALPLFFTCTPIRLLVVFKIGRAHV